VFNTYINIQWSISQTPQNFIIFIIVINNNKHNKVLSCLTDTSLYIYIGTLHSPAAFGDFFNESDSPEFIIVRSLPLRYRFSLDMLTNKTGPQSRPIDRKQRYGRMEILNKSRPRKAGYTVINVRKGSKACSSETCVAVLVLPLLTEKTELRQSLHRPSYVCMRKYK